MGDDYRAAYRYVAALDPHHTMVTDPHESVEWSLPTEVVRVLSAVPGGASAALAAVHAAALVHRESASQAKKIRANCQVCTASSLTTTLQWASSVLEQLRACQVLVQESELISKLSVESTDGSDTLDSVVVVSKNRPAMCEKAMLEHLSAWRQDRGSYRRCLVSDDSIGPTAAAVVRRLRRVSVECPGPVEYVGPKEKRELAEALVTAAGIPPHVIEYALCGAARPRSFGANRNCVLLYTLGQRVLTCDDDILNIPSVPPVVGTKTVFDSGDCEPADVWVFDSRATALAAARASSQSVVRTHALWLSRQIATVARGAAIELRHVDPGMASDVIRGEGRVVLTFGGLCGDSAGRSPLWRLLLPGATRERLCRGTTEYQLAKSSREVIQSPTSPWITAVRHCMAPTMGFDNREWLPPFAPAGRNEDGVFAALVGAVQPSGYAAYLPVLVRHVPRRRRWYGERSMQSHLASWLLSDALVALIRSAARDLRSRDHAQRLPELGRALCRISERRDALNAQVRELFVARARGNVEVLEQCLTEPGHQRPEWVRDISACVGAATLAASGAADYLPSDMRCSSEAPDARAELLRREVGRFGELLTWWPTIVQATRRVMREGAHLRPVRVE